MTQLSTDPTTLGRLEDRAPFGTFAYPGTLEQWFQLCEAVAAQTRDQTERRASWRGWAWRRGGGGRASPAGGAPAT